MGTPVTMLRAAGGSPAVVGTPGALRGSRRQGARSLGIFQGLGRPEVTGDRCHRVLCCARRLGRRELLGVGLAGLLYNSNGDAFAEVNAGGSSSKAQASTTAPVTPTQPAARIENGKSSQSEVTAVSSAREGTAEEEAPKPQQPPKKTKEQLEVEANRILQEEEVQKAESEKKKKKNRLQELQEVRMKLGQKQVQILEKEQDLLEKAQTIEVLQEELELERNLRELLIKEKDKAEEQAKLALGLCGQSLLLP